MYLPFCPIGKVFERSILIYFNAYFAFCVSNNFNKYFKLFESILSNIDRENMFCAYFIKRRSATDNSRCSNYER